MHGTCIKTKKNEALLGAIFSNRLFLPPGPTYLPQYAIVENSYAVFFS
jgi:hypothetical protein